LFRRRSWKTIAEYSKSEDGEEKRSEEKERKSENECGL
jgi:hypothetical protein